MASRTKLIGDIGTAKIISELLMYNISVLLPYDDNSPYDIVAIINGKYCRIQVKTTEKVRFSEKMEFSIDRSGPYKITPREYSDDEVDYFALYCIENDWCGLIGFEDYSPTSMFRVVPTANNQTKGIKFAEDYTLDKQLRKIFNVTNIRDSIVHDEVKHTGNRDRKTKICPICNKNKIKENSKMCRECYDKQIKFKRWIKSVTCPKCKKNFKSPNSKMCLLCYVKEKNKIFRK